MTDSVGPERIGKRFPVQGELAEVLETKEATAEFSTLSDEEDSVEASRLQGNVIEVYAPLFAGQHEVVSAYEVYANADPLEQSIAERKERSGSRAPRSSPSSGCCSCFLLETPRGCFDARPPPFASVPPL